MKGNTVNTVTPILREHVSQRPNAPKGKRKLASLPANDNDSVTDRAAAGITSMASVQSSKASGR